jgi:hypothetical protein
MFDYGSVCDGPSVHGPYQETCNQAKYGQEVPPLYDISRVTTKAAVMYGERQPAQGSKGPGRGAQGVLPWGTQPDGGGWTVEKAGAARAAARGVGTRRGEATP